MRGYGTNSWKASPFFYFTSSFKVQGLLGLCRLIIWHRVKENVEQAARQGKNIPIDFCPLWVLIKAVVLPFQGNSSPLDIRQQAEHLLCEYEFDDETLQKAQL